MVRGNILWVSLCRALPPVKNCHAGYPASIVGGFWRRYDLWYRARDPLRHRLSAGAAAPERCRGCVASKEYLAAEHRKPLSAAPHSGRTWWRCWSGTIPGIRKRSANAFAGGGQCPGSPGGSPGALTMMEGSGSKRFPGPNERNRLRPAGSGGPERGRERGEHGGLPHRLRRGPGGAAFRAGGRRNRVAVTLG